MTTPTGDRSALLSEIGLDHQNKAGIGRLLTTGNIGRAEEGSDGRMHARVRIGPDELAWDPAVLVMPHGGDARARAGQRRPEHALRAAAEQR